MSKMWIVIKEVYRKNVLSWSFFFMVMGPILMVAVIGAVIFFITQDQSTSSYGEIAVVNSTPQIQGVIQQSDQQNEILFDLDQEDAAQLLTEDDIEGYLVIESSDDILAANYYRKTTSKDINLSNIQQGLNAYYLSQTAENMGLSNDQLAQIQATQIDFETINIQLDESGETTETSASDPTVFVRQGVAYAVSFIVFLFIMNYVGIISQEIAAEKGSRIMEIILSSISATKHFFGKMIGIGLVILTQIGAYVILFFLFRLILQQFDIFGFMDDIDIGYYMNNSGNVLFLGLVYSLIGILIYTSIAGFLGSLVSRTEDVSKMITPIIFTALAGFYIGMYAMTSTNNPIVRIGSQVPLFTPFVMPFRIAAETVSNSEIVLSIIISIIFMVLCLWFSAVFYKSNVLIYSDKGLINTFKRSFALWKSEKEAQ